MGYAASELLLNVILPNSQSMASKWQSTNDPSSAGLTSSSKEAQPSITAAGDCQERLTLFALIKLWPMAM